MANAWHLRFKNYLVFIDLISMGVILMSIVQISSKILVTGGHYVLSSERKRDNGATLHSLRIALELYKKCAPLANTELGILINDMGLLCSEKSCSISSVEDGDLRASLPKSFLSLMANYGVSPYTIRIFSERHIRNRAQKMIRRLLKDDPGTMIEPGTGRTWFRCYPPGRNRSLLSAGDGYLDMIPLTKASRHCNSGTPACPAIMAAYLLEQKREGFDISINAYSIDYNNFDHVPFYLSIEEGREIVTQLGTKLTTANVFLSDNKTGISVSAQADDLLSELLIAPTTIQSSPEDLQESTSDVLQ